MKQTITIYKEEIQKLQAQEFELVHGISEEQAKALAEYVILKGRVDDFDHAWGHHSYDPIHQRIKRLAQDCLDTDEAVDKLEDRATGQRFWNIVNWIILSALIIKVCLL